MDAVFGQTCTSSHVGDRKANQVADSIRLVCPSNSISMTIISFNYNMLIIRFILRLNDTSYILKPFLVVLYDEACLEGLNDGMNGICIGTLLANGRYVPVSNALFLVKSRVGR